MPSSNPKRSATSSPTSSTCIPTGRTSSSSLPQFDRAGFPVASPVRDSAFPSDLDFAPGNRRRQIIQNNFEHPPFPVLGTLDSVSYGGQTRFVYEFNLEFAKAAQANGKLLIQDLNSLAASLGHAQWHDWSRWYSYKMLTTPEASLLIAKSLAAMIGALRGKSKKCLVLDLDNTLWGGVIGDDGVDKIQIGKETALAEAYSAFQRVLSLFA